MQHSTPTTFVCIEHILKRMYIRILSNFLLVKERPLTSISTLVPILKIIIFDQEYCSARYITDQKNR